MTKAEIRKKIEELIAKRKTLLEKVEAAKDDNELDNIERDIRKLDMQINGYKTQLAADEQTDDLLNDPAIRKDEPQVDTRSLKPLNGVIKTPEAQARGAEDGTDIAYRKAFMEFVLRKKPIPTELRSQAIEQIPLEFRADAITTTTDVSAVIPINIMNRIVEPKEKKETILSLINITHIKGGVRIPKSSLKPVATWVEERKTPDKQKKTVDDYIDFGYFKLKCPIAMSLETTVVTLEIFETRFVQQVFEAMDKALAAAVINGNGTTQPKGILKETAPTGQALTAVMPSYQLLIDAEAALPEEYEDNTVWLMTKRTFMRFYGLTDANGQPIARVNAGFDGKPERMLLGRKVITTKLLDSYSESLAAGKIFAFLFNFSDYTMNINLGMKTKFYEDEDLDDTIFKAVMLADGKVVDKGSLVTIAKAAASASAS